MATLKLIDKSCAFPGGCTSSATCEVYGADEKLRGRFCGKHGQKVLAQATAIEKDVAAKAAKS